MYSDVLWKVDTKEKELYLTFDDGPTSKVTDLTLDILKDFDAKGTFFCIGKNVKKHPKIFKRISREGHAIGNHTFDHLKGWKTKNSEYVKNVMKCDDLVGSLLFRPPYGKIKRAQINILKEHFKIVMWDVLSEDYNSDLTPKDCFKMVEKQAGRGSIVVFHDSKKASKNLIKALPKILELFKNQGYKFKTLN